MNITLKIQKDGVNTLKEEILLHSNNKLKKVYIIASDVKESGYDIIEEFLIDLKAKKFITFGIDKKNTTKKMLENILRYTKNVYIYDNNNEIEFSANICIFEYENEAYIYTFSGGLSDNLLESDVCMYNKVIFDFQKEEKEYTEYVDTVTKEIKGEFVKLSKEVIETLVNDKLIFTSKQFLHVLPTISELLGSEENKNVEKKEENAKIPKFDLNNEDTNEFEIDLGVVKENTEIKDEKKISKKEEQEVETEAFGLNEDINDVTEEPYVVLDNAIDMEAMAIDTGVVKFDKKTITKKNTSKESKEKQNTKKINLSKVSNIIVELGGKPIKGRDVNKIKIPNYIKDMIPDFFEVMEEAKTETDVYGNFKKANITVEIIDVNNGNRYIDSNACIIQKAGQTSIEFESKNIENVKYEEMDIARIIKLSKTSYHIEFIPSGIEEYNLWKKLCINSFKGSNRHYGLL